MSVFKRTLFWVVQLFKKEKEHYSSIGEAYQSVWDKYGIKPNVMVEFTPEQQLNYQIDTVKALAKVDPSVVRKFPGYTAATSTKPSFTVTSK